MAAEDFAGGEGCKNDPLADGSTYVFPEGHVRLVPSTISSAPAFHEPAFFAATPLPWITSRAVNG